MVLAAWRPGCASGWQNGACWLRRCFRPKEFDMSAPVQVAVTGPFDDQSSRTLRFLQEAARLGEVTVLLWPDDTVRALDWKPLKFPLAERAYFLQALRYVKRLLPVTGEVAAHALPRAPGFTPGLWVLEEARAGPAQRAFCEQHRLPSDRKST